MRRLADDGLSYYYVNKLDGTVSWTAPSTSNAPSVDDHYASSSSSYVPGNHISQATRMRSDSSASRRDRSYSTTDRVSNYSDDSDVQPLGRARAQSSASIMRSMNGSQQNGSVAHNQSVVAELTPAEQLAKVLQRTLSCDPPETPLELQDHVRESISAVVDFLQSTSHARRPEHTREVNNRVLEVVTAVRNLLYVTATPTGHIPSHLYPRPSSDARSAASSQALQTHLKAAHRKVAGTLSKLVLSALAMQYDPALSVGDKPSRMESDAAELERSVFSFVEELHRYQSEHPSRSSEPKRLTGVFAPSNIGPGLPGAGSAGDWKGFGYVASVQDRRSPKRALDSEVVSELKSVAGTMDRLLTALLTTWRGMESGKTVYPNSEGRTC